MQKALVGFAFQSSAHGGVWLLQQLLHNGFPCASGQHLPLLPPGEMALSTAWIKPLVSTWVHQLSGICVLMVSSLKCAVFYTLIHSLSLVGTWKILLSLSSLVPESLYCLGQTGVLCQHCEMEYSLKTDTENKKDWAKKAYKDRLSVKGNLQAKHDKY